jgi:hypothetical protein
VSHVIAALWSSEVLHTLRLRGETFSSVCPDGTDPFVAWWMGRPSAGIRSGLVVFDPLPGRRAHRRRFVGLEDVPRLDARYRDYAEAAAAIRSRAA